MYKTASRFSQRSTRSGYSIQNYSEPKTLGSGQRPGKKSRIKLGNPRVLTGLRGRPRLSLQELEKREAKKRARLRQIREDIDRREAEKEAHRKAQMLRAIERKTLNKKLKKGSRMTDRASLVGPKPSLKK
jgi:hypothetical protein